MEYRNYGGTYYIRLDRGDEVVQSILKICQDEHIESAMFYGIGGCSSAEIQTFTPETGTFDVRKIEGMLEMASLTGNVITDETGKCYYHAHGVFAYKENGEHHVAAGHIKSIMIRYTAEIELRPVVGGAIKKAYDKETGTAFWAFKDRKE